jgi:hypothetical protein
VRIQPYDVYEYYSTKEKAADAMRIERGKVEGNLRIPNSPGHFNALSFTGIRDQHHSVDTNMSSSLSATTTKIADLGIKPMLRRDIYIHIQMIAAPSPKYSFLLSL